MTNLPEILSDEELAKLTQSQLRTEYFRMRTMFEMVLSYGYRILSRMRDEK